RRFSSKNMIPGKPFTDNELLLKIKDLKLEENCLILETKKSNEDWPIYDPNKTLFRIIKVTNQKFEPSIEVFIDRNATLNDLKQLLESRINIPIKEQRIIYHPKEIILYGDDKKLLNDLCLEEGSL